MMAPAPFNCEPDEMEPDDVEYAIENCTAQTGDLMTPLPANLYGKFS
jgi:hypothetical protein